MIQMLEIYLILDEHHDICLKVFMLDLYLHVHDGSNLTSPNTVLFQKLLQWNIIFNSVSF